ncbi:MAG: ABC transporter permease [Thaumarchaeota archaeon]|nr:ABC transporter permease [Nitrososphaerota archaeon]
MSNPAGAFQINVRAAIARARVRIKGTLHDPVWLIAETIIPIFSIGGYVLLYRALGAPASYTGFVIIGGAMIAFWMNMLWHMAAQFYWEKEVGNLEMYLVAPISRMAILLGMALGSAITMGLRVFGILLFGTILFGVSLSIGDPIALLLIFTLTLASLYSLGILFSSLYLLWGREAWKMNELMQEPIYFLSGFYFQVRGNVVVPLAMQFAAALIPMTFGLEGMRRILVFGEGLQSVAFDIVALAVFSVVLFFLARMMLSYMENLAKKEGRLTLRWQ